MDLLCGLDVRSVPPSASIIGLPGYARGLLRCAIRVLTCVLIIFIAILVPSFSTIMAFLGSALTFSICIILPLSFYLRIFGKEISPAERLLDWVLIVVSSVMAFVGTVWVFLPKDLIGAN
jgi:vesicular inhibitory amino acid transporter